MSRIVCVHGIAQEYKSRESLLAEWTPSLCGGVSNAKGRLDPSTVGMAFYGCLFRPRGGKKGGSIPAYVVGDLDAFEVELLRDLFEAGVPATAAKGQAKGGVVRSAAGMLQAVARLPFFGGIAQKVVIWQLKQVSMYVGDPRVNAAARDAVLEAIGADTRVLIGHSLGSIVAWETLCANPTLKIHTFLTLGSPLGVPALLSRLCPPVDRLPGAWPGGVTRWVNIADDRDVVALQKGLAEVYGSNVEDFLIENGATMHSVSPYLTSVEAGEAIKTAVQ
jgi:pimeloyl-ACP methyl ester carboxylesterase